MAGNGGAFSKWARSGGDARKFANWASSKLGSHPIGQIEETLKSGRAPESSGRELLPGASEPYAAKPKGPVEVPEMLKSKYWRPGAGGK